MPHRLSNCEKHVCYYSLFSLVIYRLTVSFENVLLRHYPAPHYTVYTPRPAHSYSFLTETFFSKTQQWNQAAFLVGRGRHVANIFPNHFANGRLARIAI